MQIEPVKRYANPSYPTRDIVDVNPDLLRATPNRWKGNVAVLAALTATCGIVAARWTTAYAAGDKAPASLVAPIFVHGEGKGSYGCMSVAPPVFLSEAEARQVVTEELKKSGVDFAPDAKKINVIVPTEKTVFEDVETINPDGTKTTIRQPKTEKGTSPLELTLDGTDAKKNISFEFVSEADYRAWPTQVESFSTVETVDLKGTATTVRKALEDKKPDGAYAFFYDPQTPVKFAGEGDMNTKMAAARDKAKEELRAQVKDFVAWLKAEGVI